MDIATIITIIGSGFNSFMNSAFFAFIKFLIGFYVIVLFVDLILLLIVRGLSGDLEKTIKGTTMPIASRKRMRKIWDKIEERIKTNSLAQYKVAILEADSLVDEILLKIGYQGDNMGERLENVDSKQIDEFDELKKAHQVRNKIIYDKNFVVNKEKAEKTIRPYRDFLENFEII